MIFVKRVKEEEMTGILAKDWMLEHDLMLFDFDGLLVNTEEIHHKAYQKMCLDRGFTLPWNFKEYCGMAHMGSDYLKTGIQKTLPELYCSDEHWKELYKEKTQAFLKILSEGQVELMPGVEALLNKLEKLEIKRSVVTNSSTQLVNAIKRQLPVLESIPYWVTREQYDRAKPEPDSYLAAIKLYASSGDRIIGFEDTVRGWRALKAASIKAVVVSNVLTNDMQATLAENAVPVYHSFKELVS